MRWKPEETQTRKENACKGRLISSLTLGDVMWPGEGMKSKPEDVTVDKARKAADFTSTIIDR